AAMGCVATMGFASNAGVSMRGARAGKCAVVAGVVSSVSTMRTVRTETRLPATKRPIRAWAVEGTQTVTTLLGPFVETAFVLPVRRTPIAATETLVMAWRPATPGANAKVERR